MVDYDLLAKFYERLMSDSSLRSSQVMRCIERYGPTASSLLELGCGTGAVLSGLSAVGSLAGIDISPNMLDIARARLPGGPRVRRGGADTDAHGGATVERPAVAVDPPSAVGTLADAA